jgi:excisionase family DNA binding protein
MNSHATQDYSPARRQLMRIRDLAKLLNVSRSTAWRLVDSGALPSIRIGETILLDPDDVDALILAHKTNERPGRHPNARETVTADAGDGHVGE